VTVLLPDPWSGRQLALAADPVAVGIETIRVPGADWDVGRADLIAVDGVVAAGGVLQRAVVGTARPRTAAAAVRVGVRAVAAAPASATGQAIAAATTRRWTVGGEPRRLAGDLVDRYVPRCPLAAVTAEVPRRCPLDLIAKSQTSRRSSGVSQVPVLLPGC
jgi:hypothetical protein